MMRADNLSPIIPAAALRVHDPEIVPLELGDLLVEGKLIREHMVERGVVPVLRQAIQILHDGHGATRSNGPLVSSVANFNAVLLAGGRARDDELRDGLFGLPCEIHFGTAGVFFGMNGGFALLEARGFSGWVLDLGQTQLKIATKDRLATFPRDFKRLAAARRVSASEIPAQRRRLREFVALSLQFVLADAVCSPQALVCGLPARLDAEGVPITSDYAGLCGYRELIPDALELAGLSSVPAFVLNDAELAAFSARVDPQLAGFRKILVLTLGFGIGAALVYRSM